MGIVKSMTDVCDGGAHIKNHCGAEEAHGAHNPGVGGSKPLSAIHFCVYWTIEKYTDLFGEQSGDSDYSASAQFGKRWGWYSSIYALAQGDIIQFDRITELPINQCLTYLTFEKQKNQIESDLIKKNKWVHFTK